jgi:NADPH2 dehydrogenase
MTISDIKKLVKKFLMAAKRARRVGFDCLEIHMAHGYLLHQFFSPISNTRDDIYGGSLENRSRLLIEISKEVRKIWPKNRILGARITGTDHLKKEGITILDSIYLAKELKKVGIDYISVSSGGILPKTNMKEGQAFRAKIANKIKLSSNTLVTTSGNITNHKTAENLVKKKNIDFITIARILIKEPSWIYKLSKKQKKDYIIPIQYLRIFK